ncbi:spore-associated protein A [Streptosporangium canum]|uniref:spore-associated protein A n=1 Tax=Streptosporangium canum TaxID=324952 RepID=UPI0033A4F486
MRTRSKIATLASAALVSTWLVAGAAPASAAGPCGGGYSRVGVYAIPASGARTGTLEVYYSASSGKNCALTYGYGSYAGRVNQKQVGISLSGRSAWAGVDNGRFAHYAGPVYVSARGKCIDVRGQVAAGVRHLNRVHCG